MKKKGSHKSLLGELLTACKQCLQISVMQSLSSFLEGLGFSHICKIDNLRPLFIVNMFYEHIHIYIFVKFLQFVNDS